MVQQGIVLGHLIQLDVLKSTGQIYRQLRSYLHLFQWKESEDFWVTSRFYLRFINDFSKIRKPLCDLLENVVPFHFFEELLYLILYSLVESQPNYREGTFGCSIFLWQVWIIFDWVKGNFLLRSLNTKIFDEQKRRETETHSLDTSFYQIWFRIWDNKGAVMLFQITNIVLNCKDPTL